VRDKEPGQVTSKSTSSLVTCHLLLFTAFILLIFVGSLVHTKDQVQPVEILPDINARAHL
jgi:hypothetical protein